MTQKETPDSMTRRSALRTGALASVALAGVGVGLSGSAAARGSGRGNGQGGHGIAYTRAEVTAGTTLTVGKYLGTANVGCEGKQNTPHETDEYTVTGMQSSLYVLTGTELEPGDTVEVKKIVMSCSANSKTMQKIQFAET